MRLKSVVIRHYRLHREVTVQFDPFRTLIGGPNETGKSTLVEAIHRALFLKAKGNTEHHREIVSTIHTGAPEVELTFETGKRSVLIRKRFGQSGTVVLVPSGGTPLNGEAAEKELARILNVDAGASGKAMLAQWSHLWVWQGHASTDPTTHATTQRDSLVTRIQQMGTSAILQSDLDTAVAKRFADAVGTSFTKTGKIKSGSDLERAEQEAVRTSDSRDSKRQRLQNLDAAARRCESAVIELPTILRSLNDLVNERERHRIRSQQLSELQRDEMRQKLEYENCDQHVRTLQQAYDEIDRLQKSVQTMNSELLPQNERIAALRSNAVFARVEAGRGAEVSRGIECNTGCQEAT